MIRLHHVPYSRSFRILWLLEELGLDYEIETYSLRDGSLRAPEVLEKSPGGRVPALEIDGRAICESGAIVQYLCERHPEADLMPAPGEPDRAPFLEALGYAETMASLIEFLNVQHVFLRDPSEASPVVIKLTTARLRATLGGLETRLEGRDYLLGGQFSGADVMMGFNLYAAPFFVRLDPFPALRAYAERIAGREAYGRALAREGRQEFYDRDFYPVPEV
ncbi:glutathione S-transferase family protein [Roseovarius sp. SCSIO 43702]|uniref:glutathione S-transferase family protein n=1 Tax=Roseovarius sp. SCSIO 43702 TaxID=2823043 RepID=UPI001C72F75B|nr:glutathione S-transferase family protein [Roseovarius sp. SCSIO 43702]QYX55633.1 glutathione S-transferase family protein [Roseovarius sp. SCSIO 43702]